MTEDEIKIAEVISQLDYLGSKGQDESDAKNEPLDISWWSETGRDQYVRQMQYYSDGIRTVVPILPNDLAGTWLFRFWYWVALRNRFEPAWSGP